MSSETLDVNLPSTSSIHQQLPSTSSSQSKLNLSSYRRQLRSRHVQKHQGPGGILLKNKKIRKWKKLNLRQTANEDEVDIQKVIFSCFYQYYSDDYLERIHNVLSEDLEFHSRPQNDKEQEKDSPIYELHKIDDFEIHTFENEQDFEFYSKKQSLQYIGQMIEKRQQEKYQNQLANISYEDPDPSLLYPDYDHQQLHVTSSSSSSRSRKQRTNFVRYNNNNNNNNTTAANEFDPNEDDQELSYDNGVHSVQINDYENILPNHQQTSKKIRRNRVGSVEDSIEQDSISEQSIPLTQVFTRKSSRGRVIKPKNRDQWLLDMEEMDQLDELIGYDDRMYNVSDTDFDNADDEFQLNSLRSPQQQQQISSPQKNPSYHQSVNRSSSYSILSRRINNNNNENRNFKPMNISTYPQSILAQSSSSDQVIRILTNKCSSPNQSLTQLKPIPSYIPITMNGNKRIIILSPQNFSISNQNKAQSILRKSNVAKTSPQPKLKTYSREDMAKNEDKKVFEGKLNDENKPQNKDNNNGDDDEQDSPEKAHSPEKPENLQPAKVFSRITPKGWKSFLITQNDPVVYEFNYGNLGEDRTVYIDSIKKIDRASTGSSIGNNVSAANASSKTKVENVTRNNMNPYKVEFSYATVPFLSHLQQSDNELKLYDRPTPLLLYIMKKTNEENVQSSMAEQYINILGKFYEKHFNSRMDKRTKWERSRKSLLRQNIMADVNKQHDLYSNKPIPNRQAQGNNLIHISKPIQQGQMKVMTPMTAQIHSNGQIRLIRQDNVPLKLTQANQSNNNNVKSTHVTFPLVYKLTNGNIKLNNTSISSTTKTIQIIPSNSLKLNTSSSCTPKPLIYRIRSEPKITTPSVVTTVVQQQKQLVSTSTSTIQQKPFTIASKRLLEGQEVDSNKKIKQEIDDDDYEIMLVHEHIPNKNPKTPQQQQQTSQESLSKTETKNNNENINVNLSKKQKLDMIKNVILATGMCVAVATNSINNGNVKESMSNQPESKGSSSHDKQQSSITTKITYNIDHFIDEIDLD